MTSSHSLIVIYQCGLTRDLELFEAGDQTEVGEKGSISTSPPMPTPDAFNRIDPERWAEGKEMR